MTTYKKALSQEWGDLYVSTEGSTPRFRYMLAGHQTLRPSQGVSYEDANHPLNTCYGGVWLKFRDAIESVLLTDDALCGKCFPTSNSRTGSAGFGKLG